MAWLTVHRVFDGTFNTGTYRRPKAFGGMGKPVDETGFSDHFPIGVQITEADRGPQAEARLAERSAEPRIKGATPDPEWSGFCTSQ